jgi:hypothetical protein
MADGMLLTLDCTAPHTLRMRGARSWWPELLGVSMTPHNGQCILIFECVTLAALNSYGVHRFDSLIGIFCALRQESVGKILRFPEAFTM